MNYKLLENTGIKVFELYLGTMTFGTLEQIRKCQNRCVDLFVDAVGFFDTANIYTTGTSEFYFGDLRIVNNLWFFS